MQRNCRSTSEDGGEGVQKGKKTAGVVSVPPDVGNGNI